MVTALRATIDWLEATNAELVQQGVDVNERVIAAEQKWRQENSKLLDLNNADDLQTIFDEIELEVDKIRSFFLTAINKENEYIQPMFTSVFYFYGGFWRVVIPVVMGAPRINSLRYVEIPRELYARLVSDEESLRDYISVFADSYDYGYAIDEVRSRPFTNLSKNLFESGNRHLKACVSLLFQQEANSKVVEDARMSIEIFLKAFIAAAEKLTDNDLRRTYGHDLEKLIDRCVALGVNDLDSIKVKILALPAVQSRYDAQERTFGELWGAYRLALTVATAILRPIVGRDCRVAFKLKK